MSIDWEKVRFFTKAEWGPRPELVAPELIFLLDRIRLAALLPIAVHCSWADGGHSPKSYHYTGQAVDFHFIGGTPLEQYCILREFRDIGGLGFYPEWSTPGWHVDIRSGFLQWTWRNGAYRYGAREMQYSLSMMEGML